jgi:hypothetical protein
MSFSQLSFVASFTTLLLNILLSVSHSLNFEIIYVPIQVPLKLLIISHISGAFGGGFIQFMFHSTSKASAFDN